MEDEIFKFWGYILWLNNSVYQQKRDYCPNDTDAHDKRWLHAGIETLYVSSG